LAQSSDTLNYRSGQIDSLLAKVDSLTPSILNTNDYLNRVSQSLADDENLDLGDASASSPFDGIYYSTGTIGDAVDIWKVSPKHTTGTANILMRTQEFDNSVDGSRNFITKWGYNIDDSNGDEVKHYISMENNYFQEKTLIEGYVEFIDSTGAVGIRPISWLVYRDTSDVTVNISADNFNIQKRDNSTWIRFTAPQYGINSINIDDTTALGFNTNNTGYIYGWSVAGSGQEILRINAQDEIHFGSSSGLNARLKNVFFTGSVVPDTAQVADNEVGSSTFRWDRGYFDLIYGDTDNESLTLSNASGSKLSYGNNYFIAGGGGVGLANDNNVILDVGVDYVNLGSGGSFGIYRIIGSGFDAVNASRTGGANTVVYYSTDLSAGNTIPSFYTEGTGIVSSTTLTLPDVTIAVRVNGTVYYVQAKATND